jgi:hypothetical protein
VHRASRLPIPDSCIAAKEPLRYSGKGDYYTSELPVRDVPKSIFSGSKKAVGGLHTPKIPRHPVTVIDYLVMPAVCLLEASNHVLHREEHHEST